MLFDTAVLAHFINYNLLGSALFLLGSLEVQKTIDCVPCHEIKFLGWANSFGGVVQSSSDGDTLTDDSFVDGNFTGMQGFYYVEMGSGLGFHKAWECPC